MENTKKNKVQKEKLSPDTTKDILIKVFCGQTVEDKCRHQLHPLTEVKEAEKMVALKKSTYTYSNSPDFVSAIKYLCQEKGINVRFYLNGKSCGNDIEPIFSNFNKALDRISKLCPSSK